MFRLVVMTEWSESPPSAGSFAQCVANPLMGPEAKVRSGILGLLLFRGKCVHDLGLLRRRKLFCPVQSIRKVALGTDSRMTPVLSVARGLYQSPWCVLRSSARKHVAWGWCLVSASLVSFLFGQYTL